jgi:Fur family ferric uptake transcriptional regulator
MNRAMHAAGRLRARGRRMTVQRRAVLQAMAALGCARDPQEIFQRAKRIYGRLGLVTVYRTLDALTREGLAQPVMLQPGQTLFELTDTGAHHHHLVCVSCGTVWRLDKCDLPPFHRAARATGFQVTGHRLELLGLCGRCRSKPSRKGRQ